MAPGLGAWALVALVGPLVGLSGMDAARKFVQLRAGQTMKFSEVMDEMGSLGFNGTENAVNVAFGTLVAEGVISMEEALAVSVHAEDIVGLNPALQAAGYTS